MSILNQPQVQVLYNEIKIVLQRSNAYSESIDYYGDNLKYIDPNIILLKNETDVKAEEIGNILLKEIKENPDIIDQYEDQIIEFMLFFYQEDAREFYRDIYVGIVSELVGKYLLLHFLNKRIKIGMERYDITNIWYNEENDLTDNLIDLVVELHQELKEFTRGKLTKAAVKR